MGGNILQQKLYSRLSAQIIHFSLLDFMPPVNFVQVESATFTALETQTLLRRLFLFLTPPINKCVAFFSFFLILLRLLPSQWCPNLLFMQAKHVHI